MSFLNNILNNLPEVAGPEQRRLSFKEKLKWTGIILLLFFILGMVPLFGLGENALSQFELLSLILGAEFGSIISLGIGPIVTASIVLQLLNGSGIVNFDLTTTDGFNWLRENLMDDDVEFLQAKKDYSEDRNADKFKLIQQGGVITKGDLFKYFDKLIN